MTGKELWDTYIKTNPKTAGASCEIWCYGSDAADELARLTAKGIKTGTASAYSIYEAENVALPKAGTYSVVTLTDGTAMCVIRTTRVYVVPFNKVSGEHAFREGEGDRSLSYWRRVHEAFFTEELSTIGLEFSGEMKVVCEEFEVVFK